MQDAALAAGAEITLNADQAHYLTNVLRLSAGDEVYLFNAQHGEWRGGITKSKKQDVKILLQQQMRQPPAACHLRLTLCFAPLKKDRTDFLVEKASELGVHVLQPVFTDHTQSERVNIERLQLTAIEAAEQCDRLDAPMVMEAQKLSAYLGAVPKDAIVFLAAESGDAMPIAEAFLSSRAERSGDPGSRDKSDSHASRDDVHFIIGPEGGFSAKEFESFSRIPQLRLIRLGARLLRAETAAVAVLSAFQAVAGDWR